MSTIRPSITIAKKPDQTGAHSTGPALNNNAAEVFFNFSSPGLKGSYSFGSTTALDGTLQWSNGTCSGTYCHSKGDGSEGFGSAAMTWASPEKTLGCNGCHGRSNATGTPDYVNGGAGVPLANSHAKHVASANDCDACHTNTTATGTTIPLRGQGMPRLRGRGHGDHVVRVDVEVPDPRSLSSEQLELLRRLAELDGREVRTERGVLGRVKDLFG